MASELFAAVFEDFDSETQVSLVRATSAEEAAALVCEDAGIDMTTGTPVQTKKRNGLYMTIYRVDLTGRSVS